MVTRDGNHESEAVREAVRGVVDRVIEDDEFPADLSSAIGDADHGVDMVRGFGAVAKKLDDPETADPDGILETIGTTSVSDMASAAL